MADIANIIDRARALPEEAKGIQITDKQTLESASLFVTEVILPLEREIISTFEPIKRKNKSAWQEAVDQERRHLSPVREAKALINSSIMEYIKKQEILRLNKQKQLEIEAQAQAEIDRLERIELEQSLGATEEEIQALSTEPIIAGPVPAAIAGFFPFPIRRPWKARVTDKFELISHIGQHEELFYLLDVNMVYLNSEARNRKDDPEKQLPGVEFFQEAILVNKRK